MLRNLWLHATLLARDGPIANSDDIAPRLEQLRFRRLLDRIATAVTTELLGQTLACVQLDPQ